MIYSLTWLPSVLHSAGLTVVEHPGWAERACRPGIRGQMGPIQGVLVHHTATTNRTDIFPSKDVLLNGRTTKEGKRIPGPLAQLGLARDGAFHVLAAGRANHAGDGEGAWAKVSGNGRYIGIEAENPHPYYANWPDWQEDAYRRGVAAILKHIGAGVEGCVAHKEYAPSRKPTDPAFDMEAFRTGVAAIMAGAGAPRPPTPPADEKNRPTLWRGYRGADVELIQKMVGAPVDGRFGAVTEAKVRRFQRQAGLRPDGRVGPKTWAVIAP